MAEVAEVVQVVVEPLELGDENPERLRPLGRLAARRAFDRLAISQGVRNRPDARDTLGDHDGAFRIRAFEAALHPAVLEKEPRLIVDDVLPDVEKGEFRRFRRRPHG